MSTRNAKKAAKALDAGISKQIDEIKRGARNELTTVGQDYLACIVNTRNAKKTGVPTLAGGDPGDTAVELYVQQLEVYTGTNGVGFIGLNINHPESPANCGGPFRDARVITYTTAAYSGVAITPYGGALPTGEVVIGLSQSKYSQTSIDSLQLQWRPVGMTVEIFPEASFSSQNGRMALWEPPSHAVVNMASMAIAEIETNPKARVLRATQTGSQSEKIVLNWHPKSRVSSSYNYNDWEFSSMKGATPATTGAPIQDGLIALYASAGTQFHVQVSIMYEMRGTVVPDTKPRVTNSRDMDLVFNTFRHKRTSGYVGKPEHIYESYLGKAWEVAKKSASFISKHEQELMRGGGLALKALGGFL